MKKNYRIMKDMHPDRSCARVPGCPMQTVVRRGTSFHRQYFVYRISYIEVLNKTFGVKRSAFGEKVQPHRFFRFFCFSPFTFHRLLFTAFIQRVCQGQPGTLAYSLRFFLLLMVLLSFILFPAASAYSLDPNALPTGGQIVSGAGNISQSGNSMTVNQATDRMIANWNTFNIGQDASVTFRQPGASSVALNRILDQNPSLIYGRLSANGQVFLLNAAGVYFSPTSRVDVGGLVASSLNITNENFLAGRYSFEHAGGAGSIMNQGDIRAADGGYIAFLSPHITNEGTITAQNGTIAMTSGDRVNLDFTGDSLVSFTVEKGAVDALIENRGLIRADGGAVLLTAKAADALTTAVVNNEGIIEAHTLANRSGRILLLSDGEAIAGGTLDASAPDGGDGGFIETSGKKVTIEDTLSVTTSAPYGKIGTWLIDPENDYKIAPSGGDITGSQLSSDLGSNNVTILSSSGGTAGNGDIFVNDTITWSANKLTLNAYRNIAINSALFGSGTAQLSLFYGQGAVASGNTATYTINAPVNLPAGNTFFTKRGSDGTERTYTVITSLGSEGSTTATDLQGMAGNLGGYYALGANIDASATSTWNSGAGFAPIGNNTANFTGTFNGLGHTISGLTINRSSTNYVGLFGYIGSGGSVSNVGMVGGSVRGTSYVGGLVGYNAGDTVTNSYSTGSVAGVGYVGGLVGYNAGTITDSYATGKVVGDMPAGGLVGRNTGTITDSYATGAVEGDYLLGSYNGGLVGTNSGTITDSYATGAVEGRYTGGLVAANAGTGTITNSFWDTQTSGQSSSAGGTGKTSAEMKQLATFSAWDIDNTEGTGKTWRIYDGYTYPLLRYFLTTATATVDNTSMVYNGSTTVAGGSYTWDIAVDTSKIYGTASYTASSKNVGNRILSLSGLYSNQQGYDIKIIDGKVNITAKDLTASYTGNNKVYDATTTATVTGSSGDIIGGDTVTFSQTASFIDKNVGTGKTINISGITLGGIDAGNYSLLNTTAATTADITKAALTVTANDDNKIYSGVPYSGGNGVTYTGFAGGETQAVLGGTLQYSGTSQGAINVGAYGIDPFGLTSGNYAISFASGVLTIGGSSWTSMESVSSVLTCTLNTSNGTATLIGALNTTGGTQEGQGGYPGTHDILFMGPGTGGTTLTNFINTALVGP